MTEMIKYLVLKELLKKVEKLEEQGYYGYDAIAIQLEITRLEADLLKPYKLTDD